MNEVTLSDLLAEGYSMQEAQDRLLILEFTRLSQDQTKFEITGCDANGNRASG